MRAGAAVGIAAPPSARRRWLAWLLVTDAVALAIGAAIGAAVPPAISGTAAVVGVIALLILAGLAFSEGGDGPSRFQDPLLSAGLPLLLSLDNLAAGAAVAAVGYPPLPTVAIAAAIAALVCLAGFVAGGAVRGLAGDRVGQLSGVLLSAAAVLAVLELD
jgi:putative Mn2+ efflux pump MntP